MTSSTLDQSFVKRTIKNSVSGTLSGIAGVVVGHPFDTVKVRLQTQPVDKKIYLGPVDCLVKTLKWEGVGGLYKGAASPIAGQMFFRATLFTGYYQFVSLLSGSNRLKTGQRLRHAEYALAGSLTGIVITFVESPIDLFKTKMQIQIVQAKATGKKPEFRNVFHAGREIFRRHGLRGVYQGLGATLLRNVPGNGVFFGTYEYIKYRLGKNSRSISKLQVMLAAASAGFMYWFTTYPCDVIKSSMQSDVLQRSDRKFLNIWHCAKHLYIYEGGVRRFFVGFAPCLMRSVPVAAAIITVVETCRQIFDRILV